MIKSEIPESPHHPSSLKSDDPNRSGTYPGANSWKTVGAFEFALHGVSGVLSGVTETLGCTQSEV